eukprot:jgi/Ulvmu1/1419/UM011_0148.1
MSPSRSFVLVLLLSCLKRTFADYDPRNYDDLYDLSEYYSSLYMNEGSDMLDDAFGYGAYDFNGYGDSDDNYFYFSNEYDNYYDVYGFDAHAYGYDYFGLEMPKTDCQEDATGEFTLQDEACDLKISGVDKERKGKIPGGVDGIYKISGCFAGFPMYKREGKTKNDTLVLWYSHVFQDWDLTAPEVVVETSPALMYGASRPMEKRPNFLNSSAWHVIADPAVSPANATYTPVKVDVKCADGKELKRPKTNTTVRINQPVLTDEDADIVLRSIYNQPVREADPSVNFFMVVLVALLGSSVVLGVPYILKSKRSNGSTIAEMLETSRKQRGGHMN